MKVLIVLEMFYLIGIMVILLLDEENYIGYFIRSKMEFILSFLIPYYSVIKIIIIDIKKAYKKLP